MEVLVEIELPYEYSSFYKDYVDVRCEGEIEYEEHDSYFSQTEYEWDTVSISIYNGSGSDYLTLDFGLGFGLNPVVSVKPNSLSCSPE